MGCVETVGYAKFPRQGSWLGLRTKVCFFYNTKEIIGGEVVRDDAEEPWLTIIKLDDGRYVEASECQHAPELQRSKVGEDSQS